MVWQGSKFRFCGVALRLDFLGVRKRENLNLSKCSSILFVMVQEDAKFELAEVPFGRDHHSESIGILASAWSSTTRFFQANGGVHAPATTAPQLKPRSVRQTDET